MGASRLRVRLLCSGLIYHTSEQPYTYQRRRTKTVHADRVGRYPLQWESTHCSQPVVTVDCDVTDRGLEDLGLKQ